MGEGPQSTAAHFGRPMACDAPKRGRSGSPGERVSRELAAAAWPRVGRFASSFVRVWTGNKNCGELTGWPSSSPDVGAHEEAQALGINVLLIQCAALCAWPSALAAQRARRGAGGRLWESWSCTGSSGTPHPQGAPTTGAAPQPMTRQPSSFYATGLASMPLSTACRPSRCGTGRRRNPPCQMIHRKNTGETDACCSSSHAVAAKPCAMNVPGSPVLLPGLIHRTQPVVVYQTPVWQGLHRHGKGISAIKGT